MGILEISSSNGKNTEADRKDRNLPAKFANQLIDKFSHRKPMTMSNQTPFAKAIKSHLTEK